MKNNWNLATWNVRSVFSAGSLRNLTQELNRFNIMIAAIQETRQQGSDIFDNGDYDLQNTTVLCRTNCAYHTCQKKKGV